MGTVSSIKKVHKTTQRRIKGIYQNNTMARYVQAIISRDDFLDQVGEWLETLEDEHMQALRRIIFEIDLSDTELLSDTLYQYGSHLTERNFFGRKFFEQMVIFLKQRDENFYIADVTTD